MTKHVFTALAIAALAIAGCSSDSSGSSMPATTTGTGGATGSGGASDGTGTGPGASLKCASSGKNAWETYGMAGFVAVNDQLFANVTNELAANGSKNLGDSFSKIGTGNPASTSDDLATFKARVGAFLIFAYGGPNGYTGPDMVTAHTGLAITSDQYDFFVTQMVVPALTAKGVTMDDVSSCFAPIVTDPTFEASIVGH